MKLLTPVLGFVIAATVATAGCAHDHYRRGNGPYSSDGYSDRDSNRHESRDRDDRRFRREGSGGDVITLAAELHDRSSRVAQLATGHRGEGRRHSEKELEELTRKFARRAAELRTNLDRDGGGGTRRDLDKLNDLAKDIDAEFRAQRMPREISEEWNGVLGVLGQLQRSLGGYRR
ncbi:MAG: hypothetical protein ABIT01_04815 [Thermoanaerobaculia bacterium]